jgi:hypothetical protein
MRAGVGIGVAALGYGAAVTIISGGGLGALVVNTVEGAFLAGLGFAIFSRAANGRLRVGLVAGTTLVWAVLALILNSAGDAGFLGVVVYYLGGVAFVCVSAAWLIGTLVRHRGEGGGFRKSTYAPVAVEFLILAVVIVGVSFDGAFRLRFALSRPALESTARQIASGARPASPGWVGLFHASEVERRGSMVRFIVGDLTLDDFGLVYSPGGEPVDLDEDTYYRIDSVWWSWRRSW